MEGQIIPFKLYLVQHDDERKKIEIRKINIPRNQCTFVHFKEKIVQTFPSLLCPNPKIFWLDEENEKITVRNDEDLRICIESGQETSIVKINVVKSINKQRQNDSGVWWVNSASNPGDLIQTPSARRILERIASRSHF